MKKKYEHRGEVICLNEKLTSDSFTKAYKVFKRAKLISKICKKRKINTVLSFLHDSNFSSVLSRTLFGNKSRIIISERNNTLKQSRLFQFLVRRLYHKADLVVCVSKKIEDLLNKEFSVVKSKTIYNFKDLEDIVKKSNEVIPDKHKKYFISKNVLINIGRLHEQKNHSALIRSFSEVNKKKPDSKLLIIGNGEYYNNIKKLIAKLKLDKNVFLLGHIDNVFPYIKKSIAFVLSSGYEGMPNSVLESLSLNKPIISTDCISGPREMLCPEIKINQKLKYPYYGKYGILVKTLKNSKYFFTLKEKPLLKEEKVLSDIMLEIIENKELRQKYSKGLKRAKNFDKKNIIKEWEKVLN